MLALDFMRQALVAAVLVGIAAPMIGVFLVQRQMSLIGDGIGHVALAGSRRVLGRHDRRDILVGALAGIVAGILFQTL